MFAEAFLNTMGSWAHYGFITVKGRIMALSLIWRPMALSLLCRGGSKGKSDRYKLFIVMALLEGFEGMLPRNIFKSGTSETAFAAI